MLQFVTPIAFIALTSLAVPVLIHLWSRGLGRRVRVGSLRFLEETERRQLRTIRLSQVPLLLIRLLVLSVLVFLAAQPVWIDEKPVAEKQAERWVLVHPEVMEQASFADAYRTLDSLAATGTSVRLLASGFPMLDLDEAVPVGEGSVDIWSLLREVDRAMPDGSTIAVMGPSRVADFRGARPALRSSVEWIKVDEATPNRWIAAARWISADSLQVTVGMSRPTQTRFARYLVEAPSSGSLIADEGGLALDLDATRTQVVMRPTDAYPRDDALSVMQADTTRRVVLAHSPARRDDARYVAAALRAVVEVMHRPLTITTTETDTVPEAADVLFWLHEKPAPPTVADRVEAGLVFLSDADTAVWRDVQRRVVLEHNIPGEPPVLKRRVTASQRGQVLWRDSAGEPLLERVDVGTGSRYWFYSRFHPSAGSLVRSTAFPEWIGMLLYEEEASHSPSDRRRLSTAQRMPTQHTGSFLRESKPIATRLHKPLWVFLLALFMLERWVAHRQST